MREKRVSEKERQSWRETEKESEKVERPQKSVGERQRRVNKKQWSVVMMSHYRRNNVKTILVW